MSATTGTRGRGVPSGNAGSGGREGRGGRVGVDVLIDGVVGLVVTALLLAGLARPGFPLLRDWVATPRPPLSDAALGLGESAARAVPQDVALSWASTALAGLGLPVWPLTGLLTAVFCVWLAVAAGALVRQVLPGGVSVWLRLPAVVGAVWNPFVVERLLQGHWSLLAGVAAVMTMPVLLARAKRADPLDSRDGPDPTEGPARLGAAAEGQSEGRRQSRWVRWPVDLRALFGPFRARKSARIEHSGRVSQAVSAPDAADAADAAGAPAPGSVPAFDPGTLRIAGACAALAIAGLTPTGWVLAVIAAAVSLAFADVPGLRRVRAAVALSVTAAVAALPWLLATALAGAGGVDAAGAAGAGAAGAGGAGPAGQAGAAATGVAAFAARAEPGIGTLGSVMALGGIWNSEAVPPSRATWWAAVALVLMLVVWAVAARGLWRSRHVPAVRATVPLAIVTWLLVALAATGPGIAMLESLVRTVPGAGLLRDSQKFVALALPATVLALAFATRALAPRLRPIGTAIAITAVAIAAVPDAPRALWDQPRPVTFGPGWAEVAAIVDDQPGDLLVLPAGSFRSTPLWAGGRAVLDPAPRLLDTRVLVPGDLVVSGETVSGEGDRARRATDALLRGEDPQALADLGVRWVLDERTSAGPRGEAARTLDGAGAGRPGGATETGSTGAGTTGTEPAEAGRTEPGTTGAGTTGAGTTEGDTTTPPPPASAPTTVRFSDPELTLYELPPPAEAGADSATASAWTSAAATGAASPAARFAVLAAHAAWLVLIAGSLAIATAHSLADRRPRAGRRVVASGAGAGGPAETLH